MEKRSKLGKKEAKSISSSCSRQEIIHGTTRSNVDAHDTANVLKKY